MSFWRWVGKRRQSEILSFYHEYVNKVREVVVRAKSVVLKLVEGEEEGLKAELAEVYRLEKEADSIKRRILEELARGVFHPIDREDLLRLVLSTDDIAAYAKAWSRRASLLGRPPPKEIAEKVIRMAEKVLEATDLIREAAKRLPVSPTEVLDIANRVEAIEEEVDDVRYSLFKDILAFCDDIQSKAACMMVKEIMDSIENAADRCEDVADVLRTLALLSL